jgi:hypothetical protein
MWSLGLQITIISCCSSWAFRNTSIVWFRMSSVMGINFASFWKFLLDFGTATRECNDYLQELLTLPEHLSSHPVLIALRVTKPTMIVISISRYYSILVICTFTHDLNKIMCVVYRTATGVWRYQWVMLFLHINIQCSNICFYSEARNICQWPIYQNKRT